MRQLYLLATPAAQGPLPAGLRSCQLSVLRLGVTAKPSREPGGTRAAALGQAAGDDMSAS
jgi:hypothetical protein